MVKDYKLIAIVILVFISIFSISGYLSADKQNRVLARNLDSIRFRVTALESNQALQHLSELRSENAILKDQIATLRSDIGRIVRENEALISSAKSASVAQQAIAQEKPMQVKKAVKKVKPKAEKKAPEPPPVKKPKTQDVSTGGNRGVFSGK